MYILPDVLTEEIILAIEADTTIFPAGWVVRLYTNDLTPTKATVIGDFTELTNVEVPGYATVAPAWNGTPVRKQDGSWEDQGAAPLVYAATGAPPAPVVVYGWYATDPGNTTLVGSGRFADPFTFTDNGDGFTLEMVIRQLQTTGTENCTTLDMEME